MNEITLYRGINIDNPDSIERIRINGIVGNEGTWKFDFMQLVDSPENLLKEKSEFDSIFQKSGSGVCACGDENTANYYATNHNKGPNPTIIKFKTSLNNIYVDPRDFLCTLFQFWDRNSPSKFENIKEILVKCFGPSVLRYFEKAANTKEQKLRISLCNIVCHDPDVKRDHLNNRIQICGRYNVHFYSAFFVQAPIPPDQIVSIYPAGIPNINPQVKLNDCF